jgi:hypothetical protein
MLEAQTFICAAARNLQQALPTFLHGSNFFFNRDIYDTRVKSQIVWKFLSGSKLCVYKFMD